MVQGPKPKGTNPKGTKDNSLKHSTRGLQKADRNWHWVSFLELFTGAKGRRAGKGLGLRA